MTAMMDFKRFLELAVNGARANWMDAVDELKRNPTSENMMKRKDREDELKTVLEMKRAYTEFASKDGHVNLREAYDKIESVHHSQAEASFVPEYIVQIDANDSVPRPDKTRKFFYATLDEAKEKYFEWKNVAEALPQIYHVRLFEHVRKGHMMLLAEAGKPAPAADSDKKPEYKICITHKSGDIQTLRFDDIRAAKATFELMKYELKANRITRASLFSGVDGINLRRLAYADRVTIDKEE